MRRANLLGVAGLFLLLVSPLRAEMNMEEGLWEFDVRYDFIGIPQHFPGYTVRQCISTDTPYPSISRPSQECDEFLQGRFGRTFTWQVNCSTEWEIVQGMGRIHYLGELAQGDVHIQVSNPFNPPQPILFRLRGERLGPCPE